jgi:putative spermidine/putrescine transport system permease protein
VAAALPITTATPRRPRARVARLPVAAAGLLSPAVVVVVVGALCPLGILAGYSFGVMGTNTEAGAGHYREILTDWFFVKTYLLTLRMAATATLAALILGVPLALTVARSRGWTRTLLTSLVVLPLLVNIVVRNLGWVVALSENGVLNRILDPFGLHQSFPGTLAGITIVLAHVGIPMVVLPLLTSLDRIDPAQREAAEVLGAHPMVAFVRVTLPSIAPGIIGGATLVFLISVGSLVTPMFLGQGKVFVLPTLIVQQIQLPKWERAAALSIVLFLIVLSVSFALQRAGQRAARGRSGRARRRGALVRNRPMTACATVLNRAGSLSRAASTLRRVYTVLIAAFLLFPMVIVVKSALDTSEALQPGFDGFTLRWVGDALGEDGYRPQLLFSLRLALFAVLFTLVVALAAAWALCRYRFPGRDAVVAFLMSPLLIPQAALAVGFVLFFLLLETKPSFQRMLLAHMVVALPYMTRVLVSAFETVDARMEEAAAALGASPLRVFRRVTLPIIRPGVFSAVLFGFLVSFDEAAISVLIASGDTTTLPVRLLSQMQFQPTPVGAAMSAVLIVIITAVVVPLERRFGIASSAVAAPRRKEQ